MQPAEPGSDDDYQRVTSSTHLTTTSNMPVATVTTSAGELDQLGLEVLLQWISVGEPPNSRRYSIVVYPPYPIASAY